MRGANGCERARCEDRFTVSAAIEPLPNSRTAREGRSPIGLRHYFWSYRKYNFPYILVRHKKYLAATCVLKDLAPAKYFFILQPPETRPHASTFLCVYTHYKKLGGIVMKRKLIRRLAIVMLTLVIMLRYTRQRDGSRVQAFRTNFSSTCRTPSSLFVSVT